MEIKTINAALLAKMFLGAAANLDSKKEWINELNVFPVPDGDTGTNMTMTIMSAAKAVEELGEEPTMKAVCKAISSGSLRGARGNSGVILSQVFRGFTKVIRDFDEVDVALLSEAIQRGCDTAYKAVMKPKEGTILTVARGMADKALEIADDTEDIVAFVEAVIAEGNDVLARTPDMLPVLKQAGVVDSGGQGLMEVVTGGYIILTGGTIETAKEEEKAAPTFAYRLTLDVTSAKIMDAKDAESFISFLNNLGNANVSANANSVHAVVECDDPGVALTEGLKYGVITGVKVETLVEVSVATSPSAREEAAEEVKEEEQPKETQALEPAKEMAFVAVSIGDGMNQIFRELGCDSIIEGGQTMNPSTEDVLLAIEKVNAKSVFVLPNNKNIIMAAEQAAELCEDKNIIVIPTKTIPQGITALINFIPDQSPFDNEARMLEEIAHVKTGQVTYAVRDTVIDDKQIAMGDYMGIADAGIVAVNTDMEQVFIDMLKTMVDEESAIISIYYGSEVTEEAAQSIGAKVESEFPGIEVDVQEGGQPVYYYTVSVE